MNPLKGKVHKKVQKNELSDLIAKSYIVEGKLRETFIEKSQQDN